MNLFMIFQIIFVIAFCCFFNYIEFQLNCYYQKDHESTSIRGWFFLIPFTFTLFVGILEYSLEYLVFGELKTNSSNAILWVGFVLMIIGFLIRISGILTLKKSFTRFVAQSKTPEHKLISHGIYRFFRHPGYFGMFFLSIGTQLFLTNPICVIVYTSVLWKFFHDRIREEEGYLVHIFGNDYVEYRQKTSTWIPFIS